MTSKRIALIGVNLYLFAHTTICPSLARDIAAVSVPRPRPTSARDGALGPVGPQGPFGTLLRLAWLRF